MNSKPTRRDFLKTASAATLASLSAGAPKLWADTKYIPKIAPTADTLIILWMAGVPIVVIILLHLVGALH